MLRALRATTASSPREVMIKPTPTNGRKVTSDSSGQWLTPAPLSRPNLSLWWVGWSWTRGSASFETAASRPPQDEDTALIPRTNIPHPEERPAGVRLEGRTALRQPEVKIGAPRPSSRQQVPGDQRDDADQHRESVMIDVAGLQPACLARQFAGRRGDPVGP